MVGSIGSARASSGTTVAPAKAQRKSRCLMRIPRADAHGTAP